MDNMNKILMHIKHGLLALVCVGIMATAGHCAASADVWTMPGYDFKSIHSVDMSNVPVKIDNKDQESAFYYEKAFAFSAQEAAEKKLKRAKVVFSGAADAKAEVEVVDFTYRYVWHEPYVTTTTKSDTRYHKRWVYDPGLRRDKEIEVKETRYWTEAVPHAGYYTKKNTVTVKVSIFDKRTDKLIYVYNRNVVDSDTSRFDIYTDAMMDGFDRFNKLLKDD